MFWRGLEVDPGEIYLEEVSLGKSIVVLCPRWREDEVNYKK